VPRLVQTTVETTVARTFRVEQVAGMFGLTLEGTAHETFRVEVPTTTEDWQIGAIVGPSGSGKTTVARKAFGRFLYRGGRWPKEEAVVEGFGEVSIKAITATLTAVGFSSPPSWVKPYRVLSNGEQFRCELARALLSGRELVVFDEFTSVVDRTVAQVGSAAVAKAIRDGRVGCRFVAVSCHYDILDWLEPDWVLDMATGRLERGWVQRRPPITLEMVACHHTAWALFAKHHYLSGRLHPGARCFVATWAERPVAFCAVLPLLGKRGRHRVSRLVTLPDFQGVGIGGALLDAVADLYREAGRRMNITTSHPGMIHRLARSPLWTLREVAKRGFNKVGMMDLSYVNSKGRGVVSFEYRGRTGPDGRRRAGDRRGGERRRGPMSRGPRGTPRRRRRGRRRG